MAESLCQALVKNEARPDALDIPEVIDRVWHRVLNWLKSYGGYERFDSIYLIKPCNEVILNSQSSKSFFINACVSRGSIIWPTLFRIFIQDFPDVSLSKPVKKRIYSRLNG